jgi:glycosyltransferase involved in cell wall biosynthesis
LLAQELGPAYRGGGIGTYTASLAEGLRALDVDVIVIGGPPRWALPRRSRYLALAERLEAAIEGRRAISDLPRLDVLEGPDWLAEAAFVPRSAAGVHARHVHGGHRALREHLGWSGTLQHRLAEAFEEHDLRRADIVTAASRLSSRLPDGRRVTPQEPLLVTMPVRPMSATSPPTARVVTLVGRLEPRKAPDMLIDAAAQVGDVTVRLVGAEHTPGYTEGLRRRATERGVPLELPGAQPMDAMQRLLDESRVVAVPSRFEPFSMVALEALAAGRPVVLSDACGAAEVLGGTPGAFIFREGDIAGLATHLAAALDDPSPALAGRDHVRTHNTPQAAAESKLAAWEPLLRDRELRR